MKKILCILTFLFSLFATTFGGNAQETTESLLLSVLSNEKKFITETQQATLLKDYEVGMRFLYEPLKVNPTEYTFVDFDNDGFSEMVINIHQDYGAYLVLHCVGTDVYGYELGYRALNDIRCDGTFTGSDGADCTYIFRMEFANGSYRLDYEAIMDGIFNRFEIKGKTATREQVNNYFIERDNIPSVEWIDYYDDYIANNEPHTGVIYIVEPDTLYTKNRRAIVYHDKGEFKLYIPSKAQNFYHQDNKLTFILTNEFTTTTYTLEIVDDIHSAPDAERKMKTVTDLLPEALRSEDNRYICNDYTNNYYAEHRYEDDIWYDVVCPYGVAYFYADSVLKGAELSIYDTMIAEAYLYRGGVAIHEKIEVLGYSFPDYFNSLETRIERGSALNKLHECIFLPFTDEAMDKAQEGFRQYITEYSIVD